MQAAYGAGRHASTHVVPFPTRPTFLPPSAAQAPTCYERLEQMALQLSPSDDLPACLACMHTGTLPALRCLALLAPPGEGVAGDLSALHHRGITRLDLRGLQLPAGFACLQHLTGRFRSGRCGPKRRAGGDPDMQSAGDAPPVRWRPPPRWRMPARRACSPAPQPAAPLTGSHYNRNTPLTLRVFQACGSWLCGTMRRMRCRRSTCTAMCPPSPHSVGWVEFSTISWRLSPPSLPQARLEPPTFDRAARLLLGMGWQGAEPGGCREGGVPPRLLTAAPPVTSAPALAALPPGFSQRLQLRNAWW